MVSLTHLTDELFHVMIESLNREPVGRDVRREHSRLTCDFLPYMMVASHYLPSGKEKDVPSLSRFSRAECRRRLDACPGLNLALKRWLGG